MTALIREELYSRRDGIRELYYLPRLDMRVGDRYRGVNAGRGVTEVNNY